MSTKVLSNKLERTCEGCGEVHVYEFVEMAEEVIHELESWHFVGREIFDPGSGRFVPIKVDACSLACVPVAALKLALPPAPPEIDLATLRQNTNIELN